jgi:hypothetical protein
VLQRRLKRVAEELTLQVMEEVDCMAYSGVPELVEEGWEGLSAIFPSASNLVAELQVRGCATLAQNPYALHPLAWIRVGPGQG